MTRWLLVVYCNGSYTHHFPQGFGYVAAALRNAGHEVEVYAQDVHHYPESHLREKLDEEGDRFDFVAVSVIGGYYQHARLLKLSSAINGSAKRNSFRYLIGGYGPSPEPRYFLDVTGADGVVIGEGELTACRLAAGEWSGTPGLYHRGCLVDPPRPPPIEPVDSIAWPAWDLFEMNYYRLLRLPRCEPTDHVHVMMSGRGCPFTCTFCYRLDPGHRARSPQAIADEVRAVQAEYGITYVGFMDDLLMTGKERTIEVSKALAPLGIRWECNGRLNWATPEVLSAMRDSGCVFVNYGIESIDRNVLRLMRKSLPVQKVYDGVEATLESGISPGLNFIWGSLGDTPETLTKAVDFLLQYDDGAQLRTIRPVTPYPGSPLYHTAIERGLLTGPADFYARHTNSDLFAVNMMDDITLDEAYACLKEANLRLLANYHERAAQRAQLDCVELYENRNETFRGFRQI